jgi:ketosteroid isomerase-like protein
VLDQTYTIGGERQAIRAPSTIVLRRRDDRWLVALVHTVPVAEND